MLYEGGMSDYDTDVESEKDIKFCWNCSEESHSPCDCNLVAKWTSLMNKNSEKARNDLNEKYIHCHERWTENQKLRSRAMERMREFAEKHIETLSKSNLMMTKNQLQFITDAWVQIVECRRILKWSYVYGYYIPDEEPSKREFFEFTQGKAEAQLEILHDLVENEGFKHINEAEANLKEWAQNINDNLAEFATFTAREEISRAEFTVFRVRVTDLTKITQHFFDSLAREAV